MTGPAPTTANFTPNSESFSSTDLLQFAQFLIQLRYLLDIGVFFFLSSFPVLSVIVVDDAE